MDKPNASNMWSPLCAMEELSIEQTSPPGGCLNIPATPNQRWSRRRYLGEKLKDIDDDVLTVTAMVIPILIAVFALRCRPERLFDIGAGSPVRKPVEAILMECGTIRLRGIADDASNLY
jgi:hypothetical protein